jgi:glyoxylase-like metal-dependent hydrolase (beta-lactamase superfamily II)
MSPCCASPASCRGRSQRGKRMVQRWEIITLGNLSRNRYWGEGDDRARRPAVCTCTLVVTGEARLLVDPSLAEADAMARELDRRTGLKPEAIDAVFLTHEHGDHHFSLRHFGAARWLAVPAVAARLNESAQYDRPIEPVEGSLFGTMELIPTPGHTLSHHSLRFDCEGLCVVIAGDAAMTRDFWRQRQGYSNSADFELAARSIEELAAIADLIIPGHDNYFLNRGGGS